VSPRYGFVSTASLLESFLARGFELAAASEAAVRNPERRGFQRHFISLRHPQLPRVSPDAEPRLVLINSHDGRGALSIMFGAFRFICSNGLLVATSDIQGVNLRHSMNAADIAARASAKLADWLPSLAQRIASMRDRQLTDRERQWFAQRAMQLRYGTRSPFDSTLLLQPKRGEDEGSDLWTALNVLQEYLIGGGVAYNIRQRNMNMRALTSLQRIVSLNQGLWAFAEELLPGSPFNAMH
jgi:hypothetical protein